MLGTPCDPSPPPPCCWPPVKAPRRPGRRLAGWQGDHRQPGRHLCPPIEFQYGHPSPPASGAVVPPTLANLKRIAAASSNKLLIKDTVSGSLFGAKDGFKGVAHRRRRVGRVLYPTTKGAVACRCRVTGAALRDAVRDPMAATRISAGTGSSKLLRCRVPGSRAWCLGACHVALPAADITLEQSRSRRAGRPCRAWGRRARGVIARRGQGAGRRALGLALRSSTTACCSRTSSTSVFWNSDARLHSRRCFQEVASTTPRWA